jgi:hypothetical protein
MPEITPILFTGKFPSLRKVDFSERKKTGILSEFMNAFANTFST